MELIGYVCAALVGISLGILGSGGSILTVPIMVYLLKVSPVEATGLSLFIVGLTSAIGGITYVQRKLVDLKTASVFALPSIVSVFLTRKFLLPEIPPVIHYSTEQSISKELLILVLFSLLMIAVGYSMIRQAGYKEPHPAEYRNYNYPWLLFVGMITGFITGILGVGGGFIIIPALVLFAGIPVRMSVGTSLLIISVNSFTGFTEELLTRHSLINYKLLLIFAICSIAGIFIGFAIAMKLNASQLKRIFGWFILIMGIVMFIAEVFFRGGQTLIG